uniref:Ig-like domain protein n=1 Tax=Siphoviridae sp. ct5co22 TaxID=2826294 RepID=A0A8S5QUV3_9CAUD|nr:MAG TPA: Ig-like domain protein [Siphoviridae sp. ct5co22]
MAIKTVQAIINGQTYNLTKNASTGKWEATLTAPGKTSYNLTGGYYNVTVKATNDAGTTGTADAATLNGLKLVVKETVAPVITIVSPSEGAYVSNSKQPVVFTVVDETDGSGVDLSTLVVKQDGTAVASSAITSTPITNGYQVTYTPAAALSDGSHTVTIDCKDHDGNAAAQKSTTYKVDTVPPVLNITAPVAGLVTASSALTIAGTTNDATSSPVTIAVKLNGVDQGAVSVASNGNFTKSVTLAEGENTIVVTATDAAGQTTTVSRTVTLDTSVPVIKSATIVPNPVDTGATMVISVTIE